MKGSILWKLLLTLVAVLWAVLNLLPLQDQAFGPYLRDNATAHEDEFRRLLVEAEGLVAQDSKTYPSLFVALREIGRERRIDYSRFFPHLPLERTLRNIEKRNQILLEALLKSSKANLQLGLDLRGGVSFVLEVEDRAAPADADAAAQQQRHKDELQKAIEIIAQRVNEFGVTEPIIRAVGVNRIEVQLAGINTRDNPDIIHAVKKPARLDFRLVHPDLRPTGTPGEAVPPGYEILTEEREDRAGGGIVVDYLFVKRIPEMTGEAVAEAFPQMDQIGRPQIGIRFTSEGTDQFAELTRRWVGKRMAIVLDGRLYSAPSINEPITGGSAQITGTFTIREANELSNVLNNPLDVPLRVAEMNEVGPSLARDAINSGVNASLIAGALVVAFMLVFYTSGGVLALVALTCNVTLILGVLSALGATLTMPGIAGIVLTVGMAVDANILIFERIREELRQGKSLKAAFAAGHDRAFTTIVDANVTTLITSTIMILFGTGPVQGFGVTLTIGIFTTMFAALVVTKLLLEWVINYDLVKKLPMPFEVRRTQFDFMKWRRVAFAIGFGVVAAGVITVAIKGKAVYGVDFAGGDEVSLSFQQRLAETDIAAAAERLGIREVTPIYQSPIGAATEILKLQTTFGDGDRLALALIEAHPEAQLKVLGENRIGPAVGREIQLNAVMALLLSLVGIVFYVAFRFETGFSLGALVSTLHDVLIVIGLFVMFGGQFSAPMIAAILLIVGYSINDTIVIFDRIREELALKPAMKLYDVINFSVNITMQRTIMTSSSTLLTALALHIFGTGVIEDLAFVFIVGVITGTFSSVYIASPIFYWYHKGDRRKLDGEIKDETPTYEWSAGSKAAQ